MAKFEVVAGGEEDAPAAAPKASPADVKALMFALKALSQRALVALSACFTGAGLFSAWWLWRSVLPQPTIEQLIGVSLYAVFFLCLEYLRRR